MEEQDVHNLVKAIKQYTSQLHQNLEISKMNHLNSGRGETPQGYQTSGQNQQQTKIIGGQPGGGGITPKRESFSSQLNAALSNENLQRRILFEPSNASNTRNTFNTNNNLQSLSPIANTPSRKSHVVIDPNSGINDVPSRFADKQHLMRQNHTKQRHREPRSHALSLYEQGQLIQQQYESQNEEIQDEYRYNSEYELPQKQLEQKHSGVFNLRKQQQSPNYSKMTSKQPQYNQQFLQYQQQFQDLNIDGQNDLSLNRMLLQEQLYPQGDPSKLQLQQHQAASQRIDEPSMIPARRLIKNPNDLHSRSQIILSSSPIIQNENNLNDKEYFQLHHNQHASQSQISRKYLLQQQELFEQKQQEKQRLQQFEQLEEQKLQQQRKQQKFQQFKQQQQEFMRKQLEMQFQQQQIELQLQSQEEGTIQQQKCVSNSCNNINLANRINPDKNNYTSSRNSSFLTPKVSSSSQSMQLSQQQQIHQQQQNQQQQQQQQQQLAGFNRKGLLLANQNNIASSEQTTPKIYSSQTPDQSYPKSLQICQFPQTQKINKSTNSPHYFSNFDDEQDAKRREDGGEVEEDFLFRQHLTNMPSPISKKNKISQQQGGAQVSQIQQQNNKSNEIYEQNQNKDNSFLSSSNNQRDQSIKRNSVTNISRNANIPAQPDILNQRFSQGTLMRQPSPQQIQEQFSKRNDKTPPKTIQEESEKAGLTLILQNKSNKLKNEEQNQQSSDRLVASSSQQIPSKSIIQEYERKVSELEKDMIKSREEKRILEMQLDDYKLAVAALARNCKNLKGEIKANDLKPQVNFYKEMLTAEQKVSRELKEDNLKLKKQLQQVVRLVQAYSSEETEHIQESEQERMQLAVRVQYLTEVLQISTFSDNKASELAERLQQEEEKYLQEQSQSEQLPQIVSSSNKILLMKQLQDIQKEREKLLQQQRIQQENAAGNGSPFGMNQDSILNSHKNTDMLDLYEDKNIEQAEQIGLPSPNTSQQSINSLGSDPTTLSSSNSPSFTEENNTNNIISGVNNNPFSPNNITNNSIENSSNLNSSAIIPIKPKSMISGMSVLGSGMAAASPSPTPMTINVSSFFSAANQQSQPSSSTSTSQQSQGIPNALKQSLKSGKSIFNSITTLTTNNKPNINNNNTKIDTAHQHQVLNTAPSIGSYKNIATMPQSTTITSQKNITQVVIADQDNLQNAATTPKGQDGILMIQQNSTIKQIESIQNEGNNDVKQVHQGTFSSSYDGDDDNMDNNEDDRLAEDQYNSPQEEEKEEGEENEKDETEGMFENSEDDNYNILEDVTTNQCNGDKDQISQKADESSLEKDFKKELENNSLKTLKLPESNATISSLTWNDTSNKPQDNQSNPNNVQQPIEAKTGIIGAKSFFISSSSAFSFQSNLQSQITKPTKDELNSQVIILDNQQQPNNTEMINSTNNNTNFAIPGMKSDQNNNQNTGITQNIAQLGSTKKEEEQISFKIPFNKKY